MEGDATTVIAFKEVGAAHYNAVKSVLATTVKRLYHRQLILTTDIPTVDKNQHIELSPTILNSQSKQ